MLTKQKAVEYLNKAPTFANTLEQINNLIVSSGLMPLLLENAQPQQIDEKNAIYHDLSAAEAHRSRGYFQALDDILNFRAKYLLNNQTQSAQKAPLADFGGTQALVKRGLISEKEANELRAKHPPVAR